MANDYKNIVQGTLKLLDGQGTPAELTILGMEGGVEFTSKRNKAAVMHRGTPTAWAKATKEPTEISFTVKYKEWKSRTTASGGPSASIRDFMLGNYSGAVSVGDGGDHEFKLQLTIADSGASGDEAEAIVFNNCILDEASFSESDEINELSFTVRSLDWEPTVTRS